MDRVKLEPGERFNVNKSHMTANMNLDLVSDLPGDDHSDTDLWQTVGWDEFARKSVELTDDGRGCFDFYVYSYGEYGQLETNVTAYYVDGKLDHVTGVGNGVMWERDK
jgi:hypothetical protein